MKIVSKDFLYDYIFLPIIVFYCSISFIYVATKYGEYFLKFLNLQPFSKTNISHLFYKLYYSTDLTVDFFETY